MRKQVLLPFALFLCHFLHSAAQSTLSSNSGINAQDTYAIMDMTVQSNSIVQLQSPAYDAQTQTTTSSFPVSPVARTFHVEVGYDLKGSPVMNIFPQATSSPTTSAVSSLSVLRYAKGQLTAFDGNGNPITPGIPSSSISPGWPFNTVGFGSGASVLAGLVVSDLQSYAQGQNASLTVNGSSAQVVKTATSGTVLTWTYVQQGNGWVLQGLTTQKQDSSGTSNRQIQMADMVYSDNASADSERQANGIPASVSHPATNASISPPANPNPDGPGPGTFTEQNLGGSQNVLFQHGFLSSGSVWARMTGWLNQDFSFQNEVIPSLSATSSLSSQGSNLENIIQSAGGQNYILIGHSQGGLISRYAAQYFQSLSSSTVTGVLTVDTPHQGADLTLTAPGAIAYGVEAAANKLYGGFGCGSPDDSYACFVSYIIYAGADALAQLGVSSVAALNDLTPGSSFLTQLNGVNESFTRAGVVGETPQRWLVARIGDAIATGSNPESALGERNAATLTEIIYDFFAVDFVFASVEEIEWIYYCYYQDGIDSGDPYCYQDFSDEIDQDLSILNTMDTVDSFYDSIIAPHGDGSDGFVQNSSQSYPSSSAVNYLINDADSHLGATRSDYDHAALDALLSSVFKVPALGACAFSTTTPTIAIASGGGTASFTFNTSSNCQWSAVSQASWITVESQSASGTGPGVVTFDVQPTTSSTSRSGTIQVGSGSGALSVIVSQLPANGCTYSVSEPSSTYVGPGAGSRSVQVATQTGCTWSASVNQPWLTTQNGSGTGSGSFTLSWTVPPVSQTPATLNVSGQIVSVGYLSCCAPVGGGPHN